MSMKKTWIPRAKTPPHDFFGIEGGGGIVVSPPLLKKYFFKLDGKVPVFDFFPLALSFYIFFPEIILFFPLFWGGGGKQYYFGKEAKPGQNKISVCATLFAIIFCARFFILTWALLDTQCR